MDVNKQLCEAVRSLNLPEVERLLALPGINVNNACNGRSILYAALQSFGIRRNSVEIFNRLLQVPGIDVNQSIELETPLTTLTGMMSEYGSYPPDRDDIIQSMAIALLNHPNIDLNKESARGTQGNTAFLRAVYNGYTDIVRRLLETYHEITMETKSSALCSIVGGSGRRKDTVKLLLRIPDININSECLISAAIYPDSSYLEMLLNRPGLNVNVKSPAHDGRTLLMLAHRLPSLELLLNYDDKIIDVNQVNDNGDSVIIDTINFIFEYRRHADIYNRAMDKLERLLEHPDIDLNIQNLQGNTALMVAIKRGRREIVQLLLDAGVNLDIRNNEGKRAEDIAIEKGFLNIARMIQQKYTDNAWRRRRSAVIAYTEAHPPGVNQNGGRVYVKTQRRRRHGKTRKHRK